jgi:holo-[acyl-carrier protein] synthase
MGQLCCKNSDTAQLEIYNARARSAEFLAGRFAAKEALYKAAGAANFGFQDATILNDDKGRPYLAQSRVCFETIGLDSRTAAHISISHERDYAVAFVVLEL